MSQEGASRSDSVFESALRSALGLEENNTNTFDAKIVSLAKKVYFQNIEFDEGKETKRNTYNCFPSKFTVVKPQFEVNGVGDQRNSNQAKAINLTPPEKHRTTPSKTGTPVPCKVLFPPENVRLEWQGVKRVGSGLMNLSNTCFLNATLQCLTYTPPLYNYLTTGHHQGKCKISGFCMTCELEKHIKKCFENGFSAIRPDSILRNLRVIARHMRWGRQEDAHEFLRYVVDAMLKSQLNGYEKLDAASKETTIVHQIFGGYLLSRVMCQKCRHKSDKFDPFLDISIDLKNVGSLEMGLKKFIEPEMLQGKNAYSCMSCKSKVEAKKSFTFHTTPNVLTFQFKRYGIMGGKVTRHIVFSERLNMRPFMSDRYGDPINYCLYAVLVHDGSSTCSGHYYCYIRAPNQIWYCMNDASVRPVGVNQILNAQAYLLFYIREKPAAKSNPVQTTKNCVSKDTKIVLTNGSVVSDKNPLKPNHIKENGTSENKTPAKLNCPLKNGVSSGKMPSTVKALAQSGVMRDISPGKSNASSEFGILSKTKPSRPIVVSETGNKKHVASNILPPKVIISPGKHLNSDCVKNGLPLIKPSKRLNSDILENGLLSKQPLKEVILGSSPESRRKPSNKHASSENGVAAVDEMPSRVLLPVREGKVTELVSSSSPADSSQDLHGLGHKQPVEINQHYNATTKWTVVPCTNRGKSLDLKQLNATSRWTVTPLSVSCNGIMDGESGEDLFQGTSHSSRTPGSEKLETGLNHRPILPPQCPTQKWDDLLSARYSNIRTDVECQSKKMPPLTWDGRRDRKDFLKDVAPLMLAYGAEVVTWDGEKSLLDKVIDGEKKHRKRNHSEIYNEELDRGRTKKFKKLKVDNYDGVNAFQELQAKSKHEKQAKLNFLHNMVRPETFN